jgi:hypothetical protein
MKELTILNGRGVLFAVADEVKIVGPPEIIQEMAEGFPTVAWEEAGLTTQTAKNRIFVHASDRANWCRFLHATPRNALTELPVHDIPDGSERVELFDHESEGIWHGEDGMNILGTPLGSN